MIDMIILMHFFFSLQVIMFSLYKTSEEMAKTDDVEDSSNNEEVDETEEDSSVEDELCKLSKLRICLCRRTANGELEYVTNCVDTELIEESEFIVIYKCENQFVL